MEEKHKIKVTDKRGRFSYLHPDRTKNITERALGAGYGRDHIMQLIERNAREIPESIEENTTAATSPVPTTTDSQHSTLPEFDPLQPYTIFFPFCVSGT